MRVLPLILIWIMAILPLSAKEPLRDKSYDLLVSCTSVQSGKINEEASKSAYAAAYLELVKRPDARELFIGLFKNAVTSEGKAYALLGMWETDRNTYKTLSKEWDNRATVNCQEGCVKGSITAKHAKRRIKSGELGRVVRWPDVR